MYLDKKKSKILRASVAFDRDISNKLDVKDFALKQDKIFTIWKMTELLVLNLFYVLMYSES